MAKPTQNATPICIGLSILALIGIVLGIWLKNPLLVIVFLLPTVGYEVYRTEGESTKWSSWLILIVIVLELIFVLFHINYNLASFFDESHFYVAGYLVPLGDIRTFAPIVIAIASVTLFIRTYGPYTKWLAIIIFVTIFVLIYTLNPEIFKILLKGTAQEGLYYL